MLYANIVPIPKLNNIKIKENLLITFFAAISYKTIPYAQNININILNYPFRQITQYYCSTSCTLSIMLYRHNQFRSMLLIIFLRNSHFPAVFTLSNITFSYGNKDRMFVPMMIGFSPILSNSNCVFFFTTNEVGMHLA